MISVARRRSVPPREIGAVPTGVRAGVWLIAKTAAGAPYPCRCSLTRTCRTSGAVPWQCPDVGRTDTAHLPAHCCARRSAPGETVVVPDFGDEGGDEW